MPSVLVQISDPLLAPVPDSVGVFRSATGEEPATMGEHVPQGLERKPFIRPALLRLGQPAASPRGVPAIAAQGAAAQGTGIWSRVGEGRRDGVLRADADTPGAAARRQSASPERKPYVPPTLTCHGQIPFRIDGPADDDAPPPPRTRPWRSVFKQWPGPRRRDNPPPTG